MAEVGPGDVSSGGGRRLWVYGFASTLAVLVGIAAAVLPESVPPWVRQTMVAGAVVGGVVGATLLERWFTLHDRHQEAADREAHDRLASQQLGVRPPGDEDAPGRLLSPVREGDDQIVRFVGREDVLQQLIDWCVDGHDTGRRSLRVQLVTGSGGVGKTRLAHELQTAMRRKRGWECRNLRAGVEAEAMQVLRRAHREAPVLFVVDYAENRSDGVAELLRQANSDPGAVRVLLLARRGGEWWSDLCQQSDVGAVVGRYDPIELSDRVVPHDADDGHLAEQQRIVDVAVQDFAAFLDRNPVQVTLPDVVPGARMLDLLSIGLIQVLRTEEHPTDVGAPRRTHADVSMHAVFDELLRHEARSWVRSAHEAGIPTDGQTLRILVGAACLLGADSQAEAESLVRRAASLCPPGSRLDPRSAARWLREQYPPGDGFPESSGDPALVGDPGWIGSLHPDRLAEHLVVSVLTAADSTDASRALVSSERRAVLLHGLSESQAIRAMIVLTRAASDPSRSEDRKHASASGFRRPGRTHETDTDRLDPRRGDDVAQLALDLVHGIDARWRTVSAVHEQLPWPDPPSALHEVGHRVAELLVLAINNDRPSAHTYRTAHAQHVLGNWTYTLGRYDDSLRAREEATRLYRRLGRWRAGRYWPNLAQSLDNLGDSFAVLGRYTEALEARREAVRTWQQNAHVDAERFLPDLAKSLHNLGVSYRDLGLPRESLTTHREALAARRHLAARHDRHRASLARSLSSIGRCHTDLSDTDLAHSDFLEALEHWRHLEAETPTRYEPDLALALGDLGNTHGLLDRAEKGLALHQEAHRIWERLTARNPVRFEPGRARSLTDLGSAYATLGRLQSSVRAHDEAIAIYRDLSNRYPNRREQNLAWSLGVSASSLARAGLDELARERFAEALGLYRRRYQGGTQSVQFVTTYRSALDGYATVLERAGKDDAARGLRTEMEPLDQFLTDL
ncbi:tetratricopeptide repeat protein [Promicromonospora sp. MEB111]|uniref:tetratricopeptide repeat protein n=1 Tax=Promicromonospora sp. MEB111 TaxID=3040301 RepID=UPI00254A39E6|nr:tetratricopeptide repeat protein [Promicromonospora sp. MEB111]